MRLHHFIRWTSSFIRTELDSTSNSPKVMKGHTRYTRHSCSSFQDRNIPWRSCIQTCHSSTCQLSVNCNITVALKSSAPVPHFAVLLVNYLGQGTFDFVETSLLILGASSVVPLLEQRWIVQISICIIHISPLLIRHLPHLSQWIKCPLQGVILSIWPPVFLVKVILASVLLPSRVMWTHLYDVQLQNVSDNCSCCELVIFNYIMSIWVFHLRLY